MGSLLVMSKLPNFVLGRYGIVLDVSNLFFSIIWVSFEYHLQYQLGYLGCHFECHFECHLGCHYIISLYLTLQVTPLLTKIKSHEIIIFHKKNIIRYFCLFNPKTFLIFAQKVQYNTLLDMKIQEVMKLQRKALGITQQDLADMSEIAISTIKKIESG